MTDWIITIIRIALIISVIIALILYMRSRVKKDITEKRRTDDSFSNSSENKKSVVDDMKSSAEKENDDQSLPDLQEIGENVSELENASKPQAVINAVLSQGNGTAQPVEPSSSGSKQKNKLLTLEEQSLILSEMAEIKKLLSIHVSSDQSSLSSDCDSRFLLEKLSDVNSKIEDLNQIKGTVNGQSELLEDVAKQVDVLIELFAQPENKVSNISIDSFQMQELNETLASSHDDFQQKLKEIFYSCGYKDCLSCDSLVPKNARYCPSCGRNPDLSTISASK